MNETSFLFGLNENLNFVLGLPELAFFVCSLRGIYYTATLKQGEGCLKLGLHSRGQEEML